MSNSREQLMKLVDDIDQGNCDVVSVANPQELFVDTPPMWMEKFIATAQEHSVQIVDTTSGRDYDLRRAEDEIVFRVASRTKSEQ